MSGRRRVVETSRCACKERVAQNGGTEKTTCQSVPGPGPGTRVVAVGGEALPGQGVCGGTGCDARAELECWDGATNRVEWAGDGNGDEDGRLRLRLRLRKDPQKTSSEVLGKEGK
ncbi:hypothetical protein BSKO_08127 [Bryopsis sp. KO-2023]|nr:hypothetical protein BSKO_08127 [Bryopsis sp. KO-2023]